MSLRSPATVDGGQPIVIFADAHLEVWGVLIDDGQPRLALAKLDTDPAEIRLEPAVVVRDSEIWSVTSGGHRLRLERAEATTLTPGGAADLQPLRVSGTATLAGQPLQIDMAGVLSESALAPGRESLRLFCSWFPAGPQFVLRASRPRGAKGQERDQIGVVALGEKDPLVFDPRLSTTYDATSAPRQAGIELWIGASEESDQYPRRVAGVATGSRVGDTGEGVSFSASALRCLNRGETGAGVYVLLRASG